MFGPGARRFREMDHPCVATPSDPRLTHASINLHLQSATKTEKGASHSMDIDDKIARVSGDIRRLGRDIALAFARVGADVILAHRCRNEKGVVALPQTAESKGCSEERDAAESQKVRFMYHLSNTLLRLNSP